MRHHFIKNAIHCCCYDFSSQPSSDACMMMMMRGTGTIKYLPSSRKISVPVAPQENDNNNNNNNNGGDEEKGATLWYMKLFRRESQQIAIH